MGSCFRSKRNSNFLWWTLISALLVFCSLLIYYTVINKDFTCLLESDCLTVEEPRTDSLYDEKCRKMCLSKECLKIFMIDKSEWPEESAMNKVKVVFDSCINPGSSEVRSVQDLLDFLELTGIPEWPYLDEHFTFLKTPLYEILGKLSSFNQFIFFRFYEFPEDFSSDHLKNLTFSPASIKDISDEINSDIVEHTVTTVLLHLGIDAESSKQMTDTFISIERERLEIRSNASEANCTEEIIVLNCIENNIPNINVLCNLMESIVRNGMVETLYDKDRLEMSCDEYHYAEGVQNMFEKYSDRDIANYIALTVIFQNIRDLDFFLKTKLQNFFRSDMHNDFSANLDKQKKCIYWLAKNMLSPLGVMYMEHFFPNTAAEKIDDLIRKFADASNELFLQQSWLGHTKYELAESVSMVNSSLNHRIKILQNITEINAAYEAFKPTKSSFISNSLLHQKNRFTQLLSNEKRMRIFHEDGLFEVNAYGGSSIYFTFGILTRPLFHQDSPDMFNYAGIGEIIGHEIGHFFFLQFENSNFTNTTLQTFMDKSKCIVDQYSAFKLRKIEKNLQGDRTASENIPDSLGLKTMEMIAKKHFENIINDDISLPGLSYSPEELLYIAMGQTWCDAHDAGKENFFYSVDIHSPPEYRVVGTLQNSPKFSEVFRCSKTSYMNPEKKCITFE